MARKIEIVAPAKDLDCGIAAIEHGADSVYIGGPDYSARAAANNSITDIEKLTEFAHQFHARVYVALNTLLDDAELERAVTLAYELYNIGVDALIIQDVGLLECGLPPMALHASTQLDNRTPDKVRFLEELGFRQVVLARELSLRQISQIASMTSVRLEAFVHGALCVSYSGQCYISEVVAGRSANRGECGQLCRHRYSLFDDDGKLLVKEKYLLSLKDLDQSANLEKLIDAGISSFKIEGRLKGIDYVKNVTAYYRKALDFILERRNGIRKGSSGRCSFSFHPDPAKTFHRQKTEYFLRERNSVPGSIDTPKSTGERVGTITGHGPNYLVFAGNEEINRGDGLCFFDKSNVLVGFAVNRVENDRIYPHRMVFPQSGKPLYRNNDVQFTRLLSQSTGCRKVEVSLTVSENDNGLCLRIVDEDNCVSVFELQHMPEQAERPGDVHDSIRHQMAKCGATIFTVVDIQILVNPNNYYAKSAINRLRREGLANHRAVRIKSHVRNKATIRKKAAWLPDETISRPQTFSNSKAEEFYSRYRDIFAPTAETPSNLMHCKYCLRKQLNICPSDTGEPVDKAQPLTLRDTQRSYRLIFDCRKCEMLVQKKRNDR